MHFKRAVWSRFGRALPVSRQNLRQKRKDGWVTHCYVISRMSWHSVRDFIRISSKLIATRRNHVKWGFGKHHNPHQHEGSKHRGITSSADNGQNYKSIHCNASLHQKWKDNPPKWKIPKKRTACTLTTPSSAYDVPGSRYTSCWSDSWVPLKPPWGWVSIKAHGVQTN